jgi:hypothetical protein
MKRITFPIAMGVAVLYVPSVWAGSLETNAQSSIILSQHAAAPGLPGPANVAAAHNRITVLPGSGTSKESSHIASVSSDRSIARGRIKWLAEPKTSIRRYRLRNPMKVSGDHPPRRQSKAAPASTKAAAARINKVPDDHPSARPAGTSHNSTDQSFIGRSVLFT